MNGLWGVVDEENRTWEEIVSECSAHLPRYHFGLNLSDGRYHTTTSSGSDNGAATRVKSDYMCLKVVSAEAPAAPAVHAGDVIISVNGAPVTTLQSMRHAMDGLLHSSATANNQHKSYGVGIAVVNEPTLQMTVLRKGKTLDVSVTAVMSGGALETSNGDDEDDAPEHELLL